MAFLLASTALGKVLVAATLVLLGTLLTQADFGLYSLAVGVMMFVQTFANGGVREVLVQRGREWSTLAGPVFWLCLTINIVVGVAAGIAGEVVARGYVARGVLDDPARLTGLLWVAAATVPLSTFPSVLTARLSIDLRFRSVAWLQACSVTVRYAGQIGMALSGFGVMSLVWPTLASTVLEGVVGWALTRQQVWRARPNVRIWPSLLRQSTWMVLGQVCNGVANYGYLVIAGWWIPQAQMGVYWWALQLVMQVETTITYNLMQVVFPVLARFQDDRPRQAAAALRVGRAAQFVITLMALGLAVTFPALEVICWGGKWSAAAWPLAILAVFYPVRGLFAGVGMPVLQAAGRFREVFVSWAILAVATLAAARLCADMDGTPTALAWGVGASSAVVCLFISYRALRLVGAGRGAVVSTSLQIPILGAVLAAGAWALDAWVVAPMLAGAGRPLAAARFLIDGTVFTLLYVGAIRILAPRYLMDVLAIVPGPLRRPAYRVLHLAEDISGAG